MPCAGLTAGDEQAIPGLRTGGDKPAIIGQSGKQDFASRIMF
jgi:hypothetical protein